MNKSPNRKSRPQRGVASKEERRTSNRMEKPKKFKVRTKSKNIAPTRDQPVARREVAPPTSTSIVEQRLIQYVEAEVLPAVAVKYQALFGSERPVLKALTSDVVACKVVENCVVGELLAYLANNPVEVGVQVASLGISPGEAAEVPIARIKKGAALYGRAEVDAISFVRPSPVPLLDPAKFGMAQDLVSVVWGQNLQHAIHAASRRTRNADSFTRSPLRVFLPGDPAWEALVRAIMFSTPPYRRPDRDLLTEAAAGFDRACSTGLRTLITLMARSQLPLDRALVGIGRGKDMLDRAKSRLKESMKERCKGSPAIIRDEAILHFCFAELDRCGLDGVVPPLVLIR